MIWRFIQLRSDQTIADLHYTIQIAMGWSDSHLNRFRIHGKDYGVAHEGGIWFDDNPEKVHLAGFGFRLRERFLYEYDFYDLWERDVRLEKVLPCKGRLCPVCIGGRRLAPPEDCGGTRAYWNKAIRGGESGPTCGREDWALMAETVQRVLDSDGDLSVVIRDRQRLRGALERVKEHRAACPERIDRIAMNQRLQQYARGELDELFCDTIGA
jgi:hypothetical protein